MIDCQLTEKDFDARSYYYDCYYYIATYLQSEPFLSITFILTNLKVLIIFVHTPNVLRYVVLD
jgi:hypothetical protein